jgi:glycosyltransferase involved in cell wall biosynthesis
MAEAKAPVSVLILTLNEESNLPRCFDSLGFSDDLIVFDSFSTDRTVEIAKERGARVIQRKFDNWAAHQNWAVQNIDFKYPWVYYTDADEVVSAELAQAIRRVVTAIDRPEVAYGVLRKEMLWGQWLRYSAQYPIWIVRLFKPDRIRWERLVNPVAVIQGPMGRLPKHIIHYTFNKGMTQWIAKHIDYALLEAREVVSRSGFEDFWGAFSVGDPVRRRKSLKALSYRLPFRPLMRFVYMYVFRRGFLDGYAGFTYCRLLSMYEFMIDLNRREIRRARRGLST